jgi:hypothetical protein
MLDLSGEPCTEFEYEFVSRPQKVVVRRRMRSESIEVTKKEKITFKSVREANRANFPKVGCA